MLRFSDPAGSVDGSRKRRRRSCLPLPMTASAPRLVFTRLNSPARAYPYRRFAAALADSRRTARGHRGSLVLRCRAFSSPSPSRFIPALSIGNLVMAGFAHEGSRGKTCYVARAVASRLDQQSPGRPAGGCFARLAEDHRARDELLRFVQRRSDWLSLAVTIRMYGLHIGARCSRRHRLSSGPSANVTRRSSASPRCGSQAHPEQQRVV